MFEHTLKDVKVGDIIRIRYNQSSMASDIPTDRIAEVEVVCVDRGIGLAWNEDYDHINENTSLTNHLHILKNNERVRDGNFKFATLLSGDWNERPCQIVKSAIKNDEPEPQILESKIKEFDGLTDLANKTNLIEEEPEKEISFAPLGMILGAAIGSLLSTAVKPTHTGVRVQVDESTIDEALPEEDREATV